jgi:hypothetical protein
MMYSKKKKKEYDINSWRCMMYPHQMSCMSVVDKYFLSVVHWYYVAGWGHRLCRICRILRHRSYKALSQKNDKSNW